MPTPMNRALTLSLTERECEIIKQCCLGLEELNKPESTRARFAFICNSMLETLREPCAYIQTAESNYIKLADALLHFEIYALGYCGRQQDSQSLRRRIYQLLAC